MKDQVTLLYNKSYELIHLSDAAGMVYADDFARLNKEIYELMNILWDRRGKTVDEEAQICLSLLMGFNVCMYTNLLGEKKRKAVIVRSVNILYRLPEDLLKYRLLVFCNQEMEGKLMEETKEIVGSKHIKKAGFGVF